ncbi:hypothetical protein L6R52_19740 [Myxococcota bacterium]|nr:hypothetical protein [Myxococcota bacterium]
MRAGATRRPWALALAALLAQACSAREVTRIPLDDEDLDYVFLAVLDAGGVPVRVTSPFGIDGDRVTFGEQPAVELGPGEVSFVLVGLTREVLRADYPAFDELRASELSVTIDTPPRGKTTVVSPNGLARTSGAIPAAARVLAPGPGGLLEPRVGSNVRAFDELTLHVPVDPEHCRVPGQSLLVPFASNRDPFAAMPRGSRPRSPWIRHLAWLDDDTVLVTTWTDVAVVARGGTLTDPAKIVRLLDVEPMDDGGPRMWQSALDPAPGPRRRAWAVGGVIDGALGWLWELAIDARGIELVSTTTTSAMLTGVVVEGDGRVLVSTRDGQLFTRAPAGGPLVAAGSIDTYAEDDADLVMFFRTGNSEYPIAAGSRARLHLFEAATGSWVYEHLIQMGISAAEPLEFEAIAAGTTARGAPELWAGANRGYLFRKLGLGRWERIELALPPRFGDCGGTDEDTGQIVYRKHLVGLATTDAHLHIAPTECNAVIQVRRDDLCTSVLPTDDAPIRRASESPTAVLARPRELVTGLISGALLRSTW